MQPASYSVPDDIRATLVRILAYMGGLAILAIAAASFFAAPAASSPPSSRRRTAAMDQCRAPPPGLRAADARAGGEHFDYAILRRTADGARKDVLTWGEPAGARPLCHGRNLPAGQRQRALHRCAERDRRAHRRLHRHRRRQAGRPDRQQIRHGAAGRFRHRAARPMASAAASASRGRSTSPPMQIAGWYCSAGDEVVDRATLACAARPADHPVRRRRCQARRTVRPRRGQAHLLRPAQSDPGGDAGTRSAVAIAPRKRRSCAAGVTRGRRWSHVP